MKETNWQFMKEVSFDNYTNVFEPLANRFLKQALVSEFAFIMETD